MDAPQTAIWGPRLWNIFHGLVEKSGKNAGKFAVEERRCWMNFMNSIRTCLPCPVCRKHYNDYFKVARFDECFAVCGAERRDRLREWFWKFHSAVNTRSGVVNNIGIDDIRLKYENYSSTQFNEDRRIVIEQVRLGMFQMWHVREEMMRFVRTCEELWRALLV
jgi:hypothetical protein